MVHGSLRNGFARPVLVTLILAVAWVLGLALVPPGGETAALVSADEGRGDQSREDQDREPERTIPMLGGWYHVPAPSERKPRPGGLLLIPRSGSGMFPPSGFRFYFGLPRRGYRHDRLERFFPYYPYGYGYFYYRYGRLPRVEAERDRLAGGEVGLVLVDGRVAMEIFTAVGGEPPYGRARTVARLLTNALERGARPAEVGATQAAGGDVVVVGGVILIQANPEEAARRQVTTSWLAATWASQLREALYQAQSGWYRPWWEY